MNHDRLEWVHDLIKAEEQIEETGIVDFDNSLNPERFLVEQTLAYMSAIKSQLQEAVEIFNDSKPTTVGKIKVYDIAKTHADFMIFRNGYKLIFNFKKPGMICIKLHFMNTVYAEDENIEIRWGAFNDVIWMHKNQPIKVENLVRHYLVKFIRESIR